MTCTQLLRALHAGAMHLTPWVGRPAWRAIDREVWMGRERIGLMQDRALAENVCLAHNTVVPLFNAVVSLRAEVADLKRLLEVEENE